jgi:Family of unknown function (DUF6491)
LLERRLQIVNKTSLFLLISGVFFSGIALAASAAFAPAEYQEASLVSEHKSAASTRSAKVEKRADWGNFVHIGNITKWIAPDDKSLFVRDSQNQWYKATFFGPCPKLSITKTPAFAPEASGYLDHTSSVVVGGERCPFKSFTRSEAPLKRRDSAAKKD